jgi:hypothetical protein
MKDKLNLFDPIFQELHYSLASGTKFDGNCFIYNPDMILKIQPITLIDRVEYLLSKKRYYYSNSLLYRFDETLLLLQ